MHGIGDTIYARPFIRLLAEDPENEVYLLTGLPFIFRDLPVKFLEIRPDQTLRHASKWLKGANFEFTPPPEAFDQEIDYFYGNDHILGQNGKRMNSIITHMEQSFGFEPGSTKPVFDLPPLPHHGLNLPVDKKIAVVHPSTTRREFVCPTRAPKDNYIPWCSKTLMDQGWHVISIADCEDDKEWIERRAEPLAHERYHQGELGLERTLSLLQSADLIVGGPCFILPAGVAAQTNLFIIFGGRGKFDNPHKLFDLRMDLTKIHWVLPDNFCRCTLPVHDCDKTISNLDDAFYRVVREVQLQDKQNGEKNV